MPAPYAQRTDLNINVPAPGQEYGQATQQRAATRAVPMKLPDMMPGQAIEAPIGMNDPTARPNEPITAGASFGPGPGREALFTAPQSMTPSPAARVLTYLASLPTATPEIQRLAYAVGSPTYRQPPDPNDIYDALGG
jgi:hypothetical protein